MPDPILGFDLDGVLVDLMSAILSSCSSRGWISPHIRSSDMHRWEISGILGITEEQLKEILTADLYRSVGSHPEITEDIHRWIWAGVPVIYVTARSEEWTPGVEEATHEWLNRRGLLRGTLGVQYSRTSKKYVIIDRFGVDIYVDDHPMATALTNHQTQTRAMLLARPWNINALPRFGWDDIRNTIDGVVTSRRASSAGCSYG